MVLRTIGFSKVHTGVKIPRTSSVRRTPPNPNTNTNPATLIIHTQRLPRTPKTTRSPRRSATAHRKALAPNHATTPIPRGWNPNECIHLPCKAAVHARVIPHPGQLYPVSPRKGQRIQPSAPEPGSTKSATTNPNHPMTTHHACRRRARVIGCVSNQSFIITYRKKEENPRTYLPKTQRGTP